MDTTTKQSKILYVEDDRGLAALYGARLKAEGYDVKYCFDGDNALQVGKLFKPDLILLDLMMPTLNGYDALEMFRSLVETRSAKIIIMSALSQPEDIEKAKALGADDYIVKSQTLIDEVMERIRKHLDSRNADPFAAIAASQAPQQTPPVGPNDTTTVKPA
jgi:DNA-binding response OmpR family regulator